MCGPNSKWKGDMRRVSKDASVSDSRWVRIPVGSVLGRGSRPIIGKLFCLEEDQVTERVWCDRRRELPGWRNGAKVYKTA